MGCQTAKAATQVSHDRRRLSVGQVDATDNGAATADDKDAEGTIQTLNSADIIALIEDANGGGGRKMSIGSNTDQGKTSFANKATERKGDQEADPCIGFTCRKGLKPESPNQDSWFVLCMDESSIYGVFDGHGSKGHDVSQFVKENLPKLMLKDKRYREAGSEQAMLTDVFKKTQGLIAAADRMKKLSAQMSGTTATVCIHDHTEKKLALAHVADSTAVAGKMGGDGKMKWEMLTRDHKPNLKDERQRIEKAGGRVVFDGYANHRVYAKNARYPGLNMSRCMGDLMGHQDCGITAEPEVSVFDLENPKTNYETLLLCSDGVWEFITAEEAGTVVSKFEPNKAMAAAEKLAKDAWDKWIKEEGGAVVDDITVVLIHLNDVQGGR